MAEGGPLVVGGVSLAHTKHAVGHSDADVLLHAVTDAILGAAGLADIGEMFPDTAAENRDRDSAEMLQLASGAVRSAGYAVVNLDCVLHLESPKIAPHKQAIRNRLAEILALEVDRINLKAKTGEGVGPIGDEQIIQARCVALVERAQQ